MLVLIPSLSFHPLSSSFVLSFILFHPLFHPPFHPLFNLLTPLAGYRHGSHAEGTSGGGGMQHFQIEGREIGTSEIEFLYGRSRRDMDGSIVRYIVTVK